MSLISNKTYLVYQKKILKMFTLPVITQCTKGLQLGIRTILNTLSLFKKVTTCASLTLEASISFLLYLILCLTLSSFLMVIGIEQTFHIQLLETARKLNSTAYILQDQAPTPSSLFSASDIRQVFLTDEIRDICALPYLSGGAMGLSFYQSKTDTKNQTCDIILTYKFKFPFFSEKLYTLPILQRCKFKLFTGDWRDKEETVYITANASVYHTDRFCSYLVKYSDTISPDALSDYENTTGVTYTLCKICSTRKDTPDGSLYICQTGNVYHTYQDCYYLNCHIFEISKEEAEKTYPLCSRCVKN